METRSTSLKAAATTALLRDDDFFDAAMKSYPKLDELFNAIQAMQDAEMWVAAEVLQDRLNSIMISMAVRVLTE